ncbi:hypothetical protein PVAP13_9KG218557 [Panicum virgatum]|uniref:Uncharacterized protein n=1 Tax=Panicum virgatum TaxID=38727 RepID=A0A8T0NRE2_PANVG|nr:hypothetical protein PVAP13_9KG218557 [Panicum virgatum]KAG2550821.1 hypothetical protein PVAP13_9KG218557 [Panicum virgatum]
MPRCRSIPGGSTPARPPICVPGSPLRAANGRGFWRWSNDLNVQLAQVSKLLSVNDEFQIDGTTSLRLHNT